MEGVISYRPSIGKKNLQDAVKKLSFENTNQFIDFAVMNYLAAKSDPKVGKLVADLVEAIYEHAPLNFRKTTPREHQEIMEKVKQIRSGRLKEVQVHPIHNPKAEKPMLLKDGLYLKDNPKKLHAMVLREKRSSYGKRSR
jgi:hypothetical protein